MLDLPGLHGHFLARQQAATGAQGARVQAQLIAVEAQKRGTDGHQQQNEEARQRDPKEHHGKHRRAERLVLGRLRHRRVRQFFDLFAVLRNQRGKHHQREQHAGIRERDAQHVHVAESEQQTPLA